MPLIRPTALRSLQSTLRHSGARATVRAAPARTQLVAKRFASSGGHGGGHGESSDLPWLLAALVITPPSCWYLWPEQSEHGHGDHGDHADHHEEKEEAAGGPAEEEEAASSGEEESVEKADEKKEEKADDKDEKSDDKSDDKSEAEDKKDEQDEKDKKKDEGKSEEKTTSENEDEEKKSTDAPGRNTKERTFTVGAGEEKNPENKGSSGSSSSVGQKLGDKTSDAPAAGPRGKSDGDTSKKQEGVSNTDTKYSIPIDQSDEKSKKSDGQPETAKSKGTVDPNAKSVQPPNARDE